MGLLVFYIGGYCVVLIMLADDTCNSTRSGGPRTIQSIKNTSIEPHLSKNQKKKAKMREKLAKMKSDLDPSAVHAADDTKSSGSATSLSGSSTKSDEASTRKQKTLVTSSIVTESNDPTLSSVEGVDENGGDNGGNGKARITARDRFKNCASCNTVIKDRIQLCSGCKKVAYCNSACQKANWKTHKKTCTYATKKRTG